MANKWKNLPRNLRIAYVWGMVVATVGAVVLLIPGREEWHSAGPMNVGHGKIDCGECHTPAPGNFVAQAFSNVLYSVGVADSAPDFVYQSAGNDQCSACHENPDNRHPAREFEAPDFADARAERQVQLCVTCHQEHLGHRVSIEPDFCRLCHAKTELCDDPIDVAHATLAADERWETCLGCHDYHGNHERNVPELMSEVLPVEEIQAYFDGADSPYGFRRLTAVATVRNRPEAAQPSDPVADGEVLELPGYVDCEPDDAPASLP